ncbi:MAG: diguanylate cyclase, partial [Gammaproteobacteria bacterium]
LQHKDGYDVSVIKNASVVKDEKGLILGVVETITDLTELSLVRKRAEEAALRLGEVHRLDNIIGKSRPMRDVFSAIKAAAASDATILIQGESGTGKELVAGAIHFNSERKSKLLVTVNCSALSETLLESELFGHVKGAYTGALRDRIGRFEEATGGTVFLDEIGELSSFIQVKLLRVLQEREIERVGESKRRKINIRIVTATHQDLYAKVGEGDFREDLYYRLKVFPIKIPPLRDHKEDIPLLVSHFVKTMNKKTGKSILDTSRQVMRTFMDYNWPGNVRELENAIEHAFVLCNHDRIELDDLPVEIRRNNKAAKIKARSRNTSAKQQKLTREKLLSLLDDCAWSKAEVARRVGLSHTSIWKYMKKWNIPLQRHKQKPAPGAKT